MKILKIVLCVLAVVTIAANAAVIYQQGGVDDTPPEITIESEVLELSVHAQTPEYMTGVTAWDEKDGDLTDQVMVEHLSQFIGPGTVRITYAVFDKAGNAATASRTLQYTDYTGPRFQLSQALNYPLGATVTLLDRLTATDDLDGDISGRVRISSQGLSNDVEGVYYLGVQVTNSLGDTSLLEIPVIIQDKTRQTPEIKLTDYIVYIPRGEDFTPRRYIHSVTDPEGYAFKSGVEVQSQVDTDTPGVYEVVYSFEGEMDDTKVILTVIVTE